ncbi:MAG: adenosine deaminase [Chloroflexi bacterium RBG_16_47_49]|nr:MAG: adenosine deaminase [Chloroflexi bacterium RBG_16_47_49]
MDLATYIRDLPKISLHVHLEGSVQTKTFLDLAHKHNIILPLEVSSRDFYEYQNLDEFLQIYKLVSDVIRDPSDFHQVTYETLEEASKHNVRYREMFWSPMSHLDAGLRYDESVDGIISGIHDAYVDFGIQCKLIPAINRERSPEAGVELVELILQNPREEVIGIGLDYTEVGNPPEKFINAYRLAKQNGLRRTAHACGGPLPAKNVKTCLDLLDCERIDHGYNVITDPEITRYCAEKGVVFTCCPISNAMTFHLGNINKVPIRQMVTSGLHIMIDCDDPPLLNTNPSQDYVVLVENFQFKISDCVNFIMNGIDGSWLDDETKQQWKKSWMDDINKLGSEVSF